MPENENGAFITISRREFFASFQAIERQVSVLQSTIATMAVTLKELDEDVNKRDDTLQKRVRALELRYYAVLAGLIGTTTAYTYALSRAT